MSASAPSSAAAAASNARAPLEAGNPPAAGSALDSALKSFKTTHRIEGKGRLSQLVYLSRVARENGLPLVATDWIADSGGQIKGAGGGAIKRILGEYGITRILASEGGRTSRGGIGHVHAYVDALNQWHTAGFANTAEIEAWWVERVKDHFNATPFALRFDPSKNLRALIRDLLGQAAERQREAPGTMYVGAMLQHLVGAKLALCLPSITIEHHSFSTADAPGGRSGDFLVNSAAIHVTTAPGDGLMIRCRQNLDTGNLHPIVITTHSKTPAAEALAENHGIQDRIEIFDIEQFVSTNLLELGGFTSSNRHLKVAELVAKYNEIIESVETDHSLKIQ